MEALHDDHGEADDHRPTVLDLAEAVIDKHHRQADDDRSPDQRAADDLIDYIRHHRAAIYNLDVWVGHYRHIVWHGPGTYVSDTDELARSLRHFPPDAPGDGPGPSPAA